MMHMNEQYKRRVRIEGGMNDLHGYRLIVHDLETGEEITNVTSAIVYLDARRMNIVSLTYYEIDEHNKVVVKDGEPVEKEIELSNPEIAITAFEQGGNKDT
jgi:hypothetical protein